MTKVMVDKKDALVRPDQLPPCCGVRGLLCGFKKFDDLTRYRGHDDVWRCHQCNRVHWEIVYGETNGPGRVIL